MANVDGPSLTFLLLCLVLVGSALVARKVPLQKTAGMVAAWIAIFAVMFVLFSYRSDFAAIGHRMKGELLGTPIQQGAEIRIPIGEDGHFWTRARVNGHEMRFLVDSGATSTTISSSAALQAGVSGEGFEQPVGTANGTVMMDRARADFALADIERPQMRMMINPQDTTNVLGMNFLSSLASWRVEGHHLVLQP